MTAILFHASTAYGIFFFPLMFYKLPKWMNWGLFISSFVLGNLLMSVLQGLSEDNYNIARAVAYLEADLRKTSLLNYLYYAINVFFLLFYNHFRKLDEKAVKYIQIGNFGVFTFNISLFEPTMSTSLCTLFIIVWTLLIPYVPGLFDSNIVKSRLAVLRQKRRIKNGAIDFFVLLPFIALYFFYLMTYVDAYNHRVLYKVSFIPYDFWWNHI